MREKITKPEGFQAVMTLVREAQVVVGLHEAINHVKLTDMSVGGRQNST